MLLDLIDQYGIQDKVEINDFTNNPLREFQQSKASLLTSKFEGFGLTVMESIEVGCPVIAYDVRYGPSEIINHGTNGYLVEPDNTKAFADCMAKIIDEPFNCVQTRSELRHDKAVENYKNYFKTSAILNNMIFIGLYSIFSNQCVSACTFYKIQMYDKTVVIA